MKVSRRSFVQRSAATVAAASLGKRFAVAQEPPIRIGTIFDLSGPFAAAGSVPSAIGTQIAVDLVNERGGVAGKYKVETVNADSQSKADAAINEVERLINQEKVEIVVGVYSSAHAVPLAAKMQEQKKILWITTAVATSVVKGRNLTYTFRAQIHSDQYGDAAANFLADNAKAKLGAEPKDIKIAVIHEDGPYGVGVGEAGERSGKAKGFQVVMREGYSASAPDLSSLVRLRFLTSVDFPPFNFTDQNGKLSLSLVGDETDGDGGPSDNGDGDGARAERGDSGGRRESSGGSGRETASFEAFWEGEAKEQFGDLGPAEEPAGAGRGDRGGDRGGARRGGRGGGGGSRRGGGRR